MCFASIIAAKKLVEAIQSGSNRVVVGFNFPKKQFFPDIVIENQNSTK